MIKAGTELRCGCGHVLLKAVRDVDGSHSRQDVPLDFVYGNGDPISPGDRVVLACPGCDVRVDLVEKIAGQLYPERGM